MDEQELQSLKPLGSVRQSAILLCGVALVQVILHAICIQQYGYFRDELYYLASTEHLSLGYVEHPPFSIFLLAAVRSLFGDSLVALRAVPLLAGGATVVLTGLMAREIGGGLRAQCLAALAIAVAPIVLGTQHFYSMNVLDQLFWAIATYVWIRTVKTGNIRLWILLGFVLGLGLFNKVSMLWLGAGMAAGLVLTSHRRWLVTPWPWLAALIALVVFLPHIIWQVQNGYPTLEFVRNATMRKMVNVGILDFLKTQFLVMNPVTSVLSLAGIAGFFLRRELRNWTLLGIAFLVVVLILVVSGTSRAYYLASGYPLLLAPGAVALEQWLSHGVWRRLGTAYGAFLLATGLLAAPMAIPLLSEEGFIAYAKARGVSMGSEERSSLGELPQHFADMHGWQELAEAVARVYYSLPPEDRQHCAIFAQNYGEAGAIDVLGRRLGLPPTISGHNSYWLWGPRGATGEVVIIIGGSEADHAPDFESLKRAAVSDSPYAMPYERNIPIYVGRKLKEPMEKVWPLTKSYI